MAYCILLLMNFHLIHTLDEVFTDIILLIVPRNYLKCFVCGTREEFPLSVHFPLTSLHLLI